MSNDEFGKMHSKLRVGPQQPQSKTLDDFRVFQELLIEYMRQIFKPGAEVVLDESTSGWHGEDEKRPGGPPALTHMVGMVKFGKKDIPKDYLLT